MDVANKGRDVAEQRAQVLAAAEAGDPAAFVALSGIIADLRRVHERLERQADAAEHDGQRLAVASLSAQQLRATEVRAKMGGVGGYAPSKGPASGSQPPFCLEIVFSGGESEQFKMTPLQDRASDRVIEGHLAADAGQPGRALAAFRAARATGALPETKDEFDEDV